MGWKIDVGLACGLAVLGCSLPERQFADAEGSGDGGQLTSEGGLPEVLGPDAALGSSADAQAASGDGRSEGDTASDAGASTSTGGGASGGSEAGAVDAAAGSDAGDSSAPATGGASDAGGTGADADCTGLGCQSPCAPNPCENGGECRAEGERFHCDCAVGFEGETCAVNIDDCSPNPCENGGKCMDEVAGYRCECEPEYGGPTCAELLSWCQQQRRPVDADGYSCVDFENGIPKDWTQPAEGASERKMDRAVSPPWAWYSEANGEYPNGALTHSEIGGATVQVATLETRIRADGLAGPIANYKVSLMCVEIGQANACVFSNGLQGLSVEYAYNGPGARWGACEVDASLQLGTWQALRLTLQAPAGAVGLQVEGTEAIITKCEIGLNLSSSDAVFRVGVQEPSALTFKAHYDNVRAWVAR